MLRCTRKLHLSHKVTSIGQGKMKNKNATLPVLCSIIYVALSNGVGAAERLTSIDHIKCIEKSAGVTAEMLDCDGAEMRRQDKRLNGAYQKLISSASENQRTALRDGQRAWLAYRKNNCELIYKFGQGGTLDTISASSCELDTLSRRVNFLEELSPP